MANPSPVLTGEQLVVMAALSCTPQEAIAEHERLIPIISLLQFPWAVARGLVLAVPAANVRAQPQLKAPVVGSIKTGEVVEIWGRDPKGQWLAVNQPAGWVSSSLVQIE